jgi:hypothetical protein
MMARPMMMVARLTGDSCLVSGGWAGTAGAGFTVPGAILLSAETAGAGVNDLVTVCANVLVVRVAITRAVTRRVLNMEVSGKWGLALGKRT